MSEVSLFDYDAERALLGAMMLSRDAILAGNHLDQADFHKPEHGTIYRAILDIHDGGSIVDPVTLAAELNGQLEAVGGKSALLNIQAETPASANAAAYATVVAGLARTRRAQATLAEMHEAIMCGADWTVDIPRLVGLQTEVTAQTERVVDGETFIFEEVGDETPTLWGAGDEVLWADGQALFIVAPTGTGKTTITIQLVEGLLGLENGEAVLGYPVVPQERVLYIAADRPKQIRNAFRAAFKGRDEYDREAIREGLRFHRGVFDLDGSTTALLELARRYDADVVILDSLKDMFGDRNEDTAARVMRNVQNCLANDVNVLVMAHTKKMGGDTPTLEHLTGSSQFKDGAGSVILLVPPDEAGVLAHLSHLKPVVEPVGPMDVELHREPGHWWAERLNPSQDILAVLKQLGPRSARDLAPRETGRQPSKSAIARKRQALDRLVARGVVVKLGVSGEDQLYGAAV